VAVGRFHLFQLFQFVNTLFISVCLHCISFEVN
jgi:hypothetical protein